MRLRKSMSAFILLVCGLLCTVGNLWVTAERSTIPSALNATVAAKDLGREKHPGHDDVHWLLLESGKKVHVDGTLWQSIREGDHLQKEAWAKELDRNGQVQFLTWSPDFTGMVPTMIGATLMLLTLFIVGRKARAEEE